jgi:hypothetical protein
MKSARLLVVVIGILLPFLARIPGALIHGKSWFNAYFDSGLGGLAFISGLQALCWGAVLLASLSYRKPSSIWFPGALGFGFAAIGHGTLDLESGSTAALGLIAIPILSLPVVLIGWLVGLGFQKKEAVK